MVVLFTCKRRDVREYRSEPKIAAKKKIEMHFNFELTKISSNAQKYWSLFLRGLTYRCKVKKPIRITFSDSDWPSRYSVNSH